MNFDKAKEHLTLDLDGLTAIALHGNLSLALRHPANQGPSRALVQAIVEQLQGKLLELGLIDEELIRAHHATEEQARQEMAGKSLTLTLAPTEQITDVDGTPARIWEGHTQSGIAVHAFISRIGVEQGADTSQFEAELQAVLPPRTER